MKTDPKARIILIIAMLMFGTIGSLRRFSDLPSSVMLWIRAVVSIAVILLIIRFAGRRVDIEAIKRNRKVLTLSAMLLCVNWILIFEAYKNTAVAVASLCYYTQPALVIVITGVFLKERHSKRSIICVLIALLGLVPVSGILGGGPSSVGLLGVIEALAAASLYATDIVVSRRIKDVSPMDATLYRMVICAVFIFIYSIFTENYSSLSINARSIAITLILGIAHSGIAYVMYYSSIPHVKSAEIAAISYLDPLESVLLSVLLLRDRISIFTVIGAVMILGSTLFSELAEIRSQDGQCG